MNAAIALYADRIPSFGESDFKEYAASLSGMVSAARQAGANTWTLWVLCSSKEAEEHCKEAVLNKAEELRADVLFALCPAFFEKPTDRCAEAAKALFSVLNAEQPDFLLFEDGIRSRELALRVALGNMAACMTEVRGFQRQDDALVLRRSSYNANLTAELKLPLVHAGRPGIFTVIPGDFPPALPESAPETYSPRVRRMDLSHEVAATEADSAAVLLPAKVTTGLKSAKRVVVCGHGMGRAQNMQSARDLADALCADLGGTRPAAIDGWIDHSQLVGISGSFIKPELCLILGASGARAFTAGVRDSGLLIAVNTDEKATIFRMCDAGAVCDCVEFANELTRLIKEHEQKGS
ncbi:MAG: electron transfer flavoprotein subunit alpha/FixB family protein [Christensenellales bacterium]|jgi:electron transfer flavoprotein alpha subunit